MSTNSSTTIQQSSSPQNVVEQRNFHKNKIFVGGLPHEITEIELASYFSTYGKVMHTKIMRDTTTNKGRGFGFVTFEEEKVVENVLENRFHNLKNKKVEVKRAMMENQTRAAKSNNNNNNNNIFLDNYRPFIYNPHSNVYMPINSIPVMYPHYSFSYPYPYYPMYPNFPM